MATAPGGSPSAAVIALLPSPLIGSGWGFLPVLREQRGEEGQARPLLPKGSVGRTAGSGPYTTAWLAVPQATKPLRPGQHHS